VKADPKAQVASSRVAVALVHGPRAQGEARDAVERVAPGLSVEQVWDARILVSELVSNSVRHARAGSVDLTLALTATHLQIEVTDAGAVSGPAQVHDGADALAPHGWGLHIVESLCESWGVRDAPGRRTVWCELRRQPGRP
jgi:anti-sigma regulatory factor (Ser/Thr protein kinase)